MTNFDTEMPDMEFEVVCTVPVDRDLLSELEKQAQQQGTNVEGLVNLWLRQKLAEQAV